ncbi:hypothetical protein ACQP1S_15110 [Micromonospora matsumotoense]|uniref:hypothetical protein n=1 Tax=Micromonospora matsumotoense TaxID=121616 RepID=UPI003D8B6C40
MPPAVPPVIASPVAHPGPPAAPTSRAPVTRAAARTPEPVTVHVHIGRIEVRLTGDRRTTTAVPAGTPTAATTPTVAPGPAPELESYLRGSGATR